MSLKAELETWAAALKAYDDEDFERSLDMFSRIGDSSKILTNMGLIYATLGEHEAAVEQFIAATALDQYLAVAYFQCGVSNFLLGRYELAAKDFEEALLYLRGNQSINYTQLGLAFTLFSSEVLFNKGLSLIYLGRLQEGMAELTDAARQKATDEHNVIDEAIRDRGEGYTVFSIPVGVLYRPSENKLKNAKTRDFLGKAKLVAAEDSSEAYTTFTGVTRLKQGITPGNTYLDPPALNRSVTTPAPKAPNDDVPLQRSKTTLNVIQRPTSPRAAPGGPGASAGGGGLARSTTNITPARGPGGGGGMGAPMTRGLSVRKPGMSPTGGMAPEQPPSPPKKSPAGGGTRMTEFYDSYIDSYADPTPPPPLPPAQGNGNGVGNGNDNSNGNGNGNGAAQGDRVAAWARTNANPAASPPPAPSRAPSSFGGSRTGTLRRRGTRRTMAQSMYEEDEEGYVTGSGDWDEPFELTKIRVKIHFEDDVRGMALDPAVPFAEFVQRVADKFDLAPRELALKFKDEDGGKVSLRDESDYELAIETARESAKGKPEGRLEVWVVRK